MEISRKQVLHKHLEPARPLRRCNIHFDWPIVPSIHEINIEQFCQIANMHSKKQGGRLSYTRKFLIGFARCSVAMRKPEFLPEHPVVLLKARDPEIFSLCDEHAD